MISCKRATELISKAMEEELSIKEKVSLNLHLFICECCELFKKHISLVRAAISISKASDEYINIPEDLSGKCDEGKKRLQEKLKGHSA
jgi:hypothetical protein